MLMIIFSHKKKTLQIMAKKKSSNLKMPAESEKNLFDCIYIYICLNIYYISIYWYIVYMPIYKYTCIRFSKQRSIQSIFFRWCFHNEPGKVVLYTLQPQQISRGSPNASQWLDSRDCWDHLGIQSDSGAETVVSTETNFMLYNDAALYTNT